MHAVTDPMKIFEHECRVRDEFSRSLSNYRPSEILARTEQRYWGTLLRADMRTVDTDDVIREWEFKINADYKALGQIIQYVALARKAESFRPIRGVIAAFTFTNELRIANEVMNLNLELVLLPSWLRRSGYLIEEAAVLPRIPFAPTL
ncbi:PDDEXK family nuclease [Pseudomonas germanica]|uniref:Uncharacterized protein n=1 Tax=Pseudomonas germanica TaxID=2815720 RepID=A0ABX8YHZ0_9PSED|nr:hypothetical protein [Pseudomonas germanica]QYY79484.1 hypothetical protein J0G10_17215 [Pseudomonas germanica]